MSSDLRPRSTFVKFLAFQLQPTFVFQRSGHFAGFGANRDANNGGSSFG